MLPQVNQHNGGFASSLSYQLSEDPRGRFLTAFSDFAGRTDARRAAGFATAGAQQLGGFAQQFGGEPV